MLVVIVSAIINTFVVAWATRRALGYPVGWPRTILFSLVTSVAANPLLLIMLEHAGIHDPLAPEYSGAGIAFSLLFLGWVLAIEMSLLAATEMLVPTGSLPGPVDILRHMPQYFRRMRRLFTIARIALKHGLFRYVRRSRTVENPETATSAAVALRRALTDCGVTFVKFGQMLATRPDVLPADYIAELSNLHSKVPSEPWQVVKKTLTTELGAAPEVVFGCIDQTPMAAASLGQVHRAQLKDGTQVAVKVLRSGAEEVVAADLDIIFWLARLLERRTQWAKAFGVHDLAVGFRDSLDEELDYRIELRNLELMDGLTEIGVPKGFPEYSTQRVLTMELVEGTPLSSADEQVANLPEETRKALNQLIVTSVMQQVLVHGIFHADLHGGNIMLTPDNKLVLLDFGSVGRVDRPSRKAMMGLLVAVDLQDGAAAVAALRRLLIEPVNLDTRLLEPRIGALIMRVDSLPIDELFDELFRVVVQAGFQVPPGIAAAFRCLGALEGTLKILAPQSDFISESREIARDIFQQEVSVSPMVQETVERALIALPAAERLPAQLTTIANRLDQENYGLDFSPFRTAQSRSMMQHYGQLFSLSVLTAITALVGIVLVLFGQGIRWANTFELSTFAGMTVLLVSYVLGSRLLVLSVGNGETETPRISCD